MQSLRRNVQVLFLASLVVAFALLVLPQPSHAQAPAAPTTYSLFDPVRLGVGVSAWREWNLDNNFVSTGEDAWRIGVPLSWELTSPKDAGVKNPISLVFNPSYAVASDGTIGNKWRVSAGITWALKTAGH